MSDMATTETATCNYCAGEKQVYTMASGRKDGNPFHFSGMRDCSRCNGTGRIPKEQAESWEARIGYATLRRTHRVKRGISLREEAAYLGITPQDLSKMERADMDFPDVETWGQINSGHPCTP